MLSIVASLWESPFCNSLRNPMKKHMVSFHEPILTPPDKATPGHPFWYRRMSAREQNSQKCTRFLIKSRRARETWTYVFLANVAPKPPSCFVRSAQTIVFYSIWTPTAPELFTALAFGVASGLGHQAEPVSDLTGGVKPQRIGS